MDLRNMVLKQLLAESYAKKTISMTTTPVSTYSSSRIPAPARSTTAEPFTSSHASGWSSPVPSYGSTPPRYANTPMEMAHLLDHHPESLSSAAVSEIYDLYLGHDVPTEDTVFVPQRALPSDINIGVHCPQPIQPIPVAAMQRELDHVPTIPAPIRTMSRNHTNIVLQRRAASTTGAVDNMLRRGKMSPKPEHPSSLRQGAASIVRTASVKAIVKPDVGTRKTGHDAVPQHGTLQLFGKYARAPGTRRRAQSFAGRVQRTSSKSGEETNAEETFYGAAAMITPDHNPWPIASGGNANIYRGKLTLASGHIIWVAIKMLRETHGTTKDDIDRRLRREVHVWKRLEHRNVLPFIGVWHDIPGAPCPALISPFCSSGNVETYLKNKPTADRNELVLGVGSGLKFLHANDIVHGDLSLANVLIDKQGVACISDFGISKILGCKGFTTRPSGTPQYLAPELFYVLHDNGSLDLPTPTTQQSDVYAFALVALQILTSAPVKTRPAKPLFTRRELEALRPRISDYQRFPILTEDVWRILDECWSFERETRPSVSEVSASFFAIVVLHRPFGK
ncbi:kinase-like domain-containing protein [Mycena amicta]|nr:kinase-like domain-containing protein [Mycena amicta]